MPQGWTKQNAGVDVGYSIAPQTDTKLTVGYRYDDVSRSNAQVGSSNTNTVAVRLLSQVGPVYGRLSYEYSDRSGSLNYLTPWANLAGTPNNSNVGLNYSGAYYQAPMTSNAIKLMADYSPSETLSAGLFLQWKDENYTYPAATVIGTNVPPLTGDRLGVKEDYNITVAPSIDYRPSEDVTLPLLLHLRADLLQQLRQRRLLHRCSGRHGGLHRKRRVLPEQVHQRRQHRRLERRLEGQRQAEAGRRIHLRVRFRDVRRVQRRLCT